MIQNKVIAVIGGIGSGKTTFARLMSRYYPVQDADVLAKEVLATKLQELARRYGQEVLLPKRNVPQTEVRNGIVLPKPSPYELNTSFLAGILFQPDEERANEERVWIAELVNEDVNFLIFSRAAEFQKKISLAEITAPTFPFLKNFDGIIIVTADEDTSILRTDDRTNGWSEKRRRRIYRVQMENIANCVQSFLDAGGCDMTTAVFRNKSLKHLQSRGAMERSGGFILRVDNSGAEEALQEVTRDIAVFLEEYFREDCLCSK